MIAFCIRKNTPERVSFLKKGIHKQKWDFYRITLRNLSLSGTAVKNAILIYTTPELKEKWNSYVVMSRNCEHFAFVCCTNAKILSQQVISKWNLAQSFLVTVTRTITSIVYGLIKG